MTHDDALRRVAESSRPAGKSKERRPLTWLLIFVVAVNVPFFAKNFVVVHDTLAKFNMFHYVYSHLFFYAEMPRWVPYIHYGIPADLFLYAIQPVDWLVMALGWLLGIRDATLLFKLGMLLNQCLFVTGLYRLLRRLDVSTSTTALTCMAAVLTNSWFFNYGFNFLVFFLLPWVLYHLLEFLETSQVKHLWLAAIVELFSLLGNIPYIAPVHLLIIVTFVMVWVLERPARLKLFLTWRTYVHPLFFFAIALAGLFGLFMSGMFADMAILTADRDSTTGGISLESFLTRSYQPPGTLLSFFLRGDIAHGDMTCYIGVLPLIAAVYGVARRRDLRFWSLAGVTLVLFWMALGGWFSTALFDVFPLMNRYRHISYVCNIAKIFVLLLGALGLDQIISDLRNEIKVLAPVPSWFRWLGLVLFCAFAADLAAHSGWGSEEVRWTTFDYTVREARGTPYWIGVRYLGYVVCFLLLMQAVRRGNPVKALRRWQLVLAWFLFDVASYFVVVWATGPFFMSQDPITDEFDVTPMRYTEQREDPAKTAEGEKLGRILFHKRSAAEFTATSGDLYALARVDPLAPKFPFLLITNVVKDMIERHDGMVTARGITLPKDEAFLRMLKTKMRIVSDVPGAAHVTVAVFTANEVQVSVDAPSPGWLVYADAFHPGWKATLSGEEVAIVPWDGGLKAVHVEPGSSTVTFRFDDGPWDVVRRALVALSLALAVLFVGVMLGSALKEPRTK